ncbi:MAG: hypothetical protein IT310_08935 [Anaerolineales bacterium]|nr:hypothetical protein [Anaerolineales bacterium]
MKTRRILSTVGLILGSALSGMVLFADKFGLDDHGGWGRARLGAFIFSLLFVGLNIAYLIYQTKIEQRLAALTETLKRNPSARTLYDRGREYAFLVPLTGTILLIYVWLVSSGAWTHWVSPTRYYANLARGFANGNLFIPDKPDLRLSELQNPYDPIERAGIDAPIDLSYYNGRYYLYWGPVPALILVPVQAALHQRIGDLQLTFAFTCGIFLLLSVTLISIWRRHFQSLPKWALGASVLFIGLAGPTLFMLNNFKGARIYEAAITGGQFFLLGGLSLIISATEKEGSNWKLLLAGTFWAGAIGSRFFLALPIGAMVCVLFYAWFRERKNFIQKTLSLTFPLLCGFIALGWYNWARFGSVTESGLYYQLAGLNLQKNYDLLIKPIYLLQNLYNYFLQPFSLSAQFPFVQTEYGQTSPLFSWYALPSFYSSQQTTGLFYTAPFILFTFLPLYFKKRTEAGLNLTVSLCAVSAGTALLFLACFFWSATRYLADFTPALFILSVIGFWQGYAAVEQSPRWQRSYTYLSAALICASLTLSALVALSINDARFPIIQFFTGNG